MFYSTVISLVIVLYLGTFQFSYALEVLSWLASACPDHVFICFHVFEVFLSQFLLCCKVQCSCSQLRMRAKTTYKMNVHDKLINVGRKLIWYAWAWKGGKQKRGKMAVTMMSQSVRETEKEMNEKKWNEMKKRRRMKDLWLWWALCVVHEWWAGERDGRGRGGYDGNVCVRLRRE